MTTLKIDSLNFKDILKKMTPFISKEETRYYLNGIYLEFDGHQLKATATNGHILAQCFLVLQGSDHEGQPSVSGILPKEAVKHLIAIITKETGGLEALVTFEGGHHILFDFGGTEYRTKLIDGVFPDYNRVIPKGSVSLNEGINAKFLLAALKALDNSPVDIRVDDEENAASAPHLFSKANADANEMRCVIMPMRV